MRYEEFETYEPDITWTITKKMQQELQSMVSASYKYIDVSREKYLIHLFTGYETFPTETVLTYSEARALVEKLNQYLREIEDAQSKLIGGERV